MRRTPAVQSLSYPLRLPDSAQAGALRLLDVTKAVINTVLVALWPRLDAFGERGDGPAWKQVEGMLASPDPQGSRQWRCEAEQVGRILRTQAHRKRLLARVLPLLSEGLIRPKDEKRKAGKNRKAIRQALADLKTAAEADGGSLVELQSLIEQACNHFLRRRRACCPMRRRSILPGWEPPSFFTINEPGDFFYPSGADASVKAVSYTGAAATLRLPSPGLRPRPPRAGKSYCNGWLSSVTRRSSYAETIMLRLCGELLIAHIAVVFSNGTGGAGRKTEEEGNP
jgi:hypothetical protein